MERIPVKVKKLSEEAVLPSYESKYAAGFDFYAIDDYKIMPGETVLIKTGLAVQLPQGYEMQVRPRSGLSLKTKLRIANSPGTIDADYRGEIGIIAENTGSEIINIKTGERPAQGVINKVPIAEFIETDDISKTERGAGGFGHTGK